MNNWIDVKKVCHWCVSRSVVDTSHSKGAAQAVKTAVLTISVV